MTRTFALSLLVLSACGSPADPADSKQSSQDYYESSGTVFFIDPEELPDVEREALAGDDKQLQRLIDYYSLSHIPQDATAAVALQRWQILGATRGLKSAAHNLVFVASEASGPDCSVVRQHARALDIKDLKAIQTENVYVEACLAD